MNTPWVQFLANRQLVTGIRSTTGHQCLNFSLVVDESRFNDVVSRIYVIVREDFKVDVNFFIAKFPCKNLETLKSLIYHLRTAVQHSDNQNSLRTYNNWVQRHKGWEGSAQALNDLYDRAVDEMLHASVKCRMETNFGREWQSRLETDVEGVLESIQSDLSLHHDMKQMRYMIRQVENRLANYRSRVNQNVVREFCLQEILKRKRSLPFDYMDILDRLGLIGRPEAQAAIMLAYAVVATGYTDSDDFMQKTKAAWAELT